MKSEKYTNINCSSNAKTLIFLNQMNFNNSIANQKQKNVSPPNLSKLHSTNSFNKPPYIGLSVPENTNIQEGIRTERSIQPRQEFMKRNDQMKMNSLNKTAFSWNFQKSLMNCKNSIAVINKFSLPPISFKNLPFVTTNNLYKGNEGHIKSIKLGAKGNVNDLHYKKDKLIMPINEPKENEEISSKSLNIDGIIFEVSTKSDNSHSPVERLETKITKQMNLKNYDFNGTLLRLGSNSPEDFSENPSIDFCKNKNKPIQTSLNFFSSVKNFVIFT